MSEKQKIAWGTAIISFAFTAVINVDRIAKFFGITNIPKDTRELMVGLSQVPTFLSWAIFLSGLAALAYLYSEHLSALAAPVARIVREWELRMPVARKSSRIADEEPPRAQNLTQELARLLAAATPPEPVQQSPLSQDQKERKHRAVGKVRDHVMAMRPLINRGEHLQCGIWNAFAGKRAYDYTQELRTFRDEFSEQVRKLIELRDQCSDYEDALEAAHMPEWEAWVGGIGNYLVICQAISTYVKDEAPQEAIERFIRHDAEAFHRAVIGYIHWHSNARVSLNQICREVAT